MDLSLKGSQINLAVRQKPKAKCASHLLQPLGTGFYFRPRSAGSVEKSCQNSIWLPSGRPKSADCCLEKTENNLCHSKLQKQLLNKRYQSISSLNLYKLLLEEPIKRPWLCRGVLDSSLQDNEITNIRASSSLDLTERSTNYPSSQRKNSMNRNNKNSQIEKNNMNSQLSRRLKASNTNGNLSTGKLNNTTTAALSNRQLSNHQDLPGRVSFSRNLPEMSLSDAEFTDNESMDDILRCQEINEHHNHHHHHQHHHNDDVLDDELRENRNEQKMDGMDDDISAPGPVNVIDYQNLLNGGIGGGGGEGGGEGGGGVAAPSLSKESSSLSLKKSVHFGPSIDDDENGSDVGVIAHTYEYHKCPSENCSCSTQSSSTSSSSSASSNQMDTAFMKKKSERCLCKVNNNCHFKSTMNMSMDGLSLDAKQTTWLDRKKETCNNKDILDELPVIKHYKNVLNDDRNNLSDLKSRTKFCEMRNHNTEQIGTESDEMMANCSHRCSSTDPLKPLQCCNGDEHTHCNHQQTISHTNHHHQQHQHHSHQHHSQIMDKPNNLSRKMAVNNKGENHSKMAETTIGQESVINNYLKVATSPSGISKKKENLKPSEVPKKVTKINSNNNNNNNSNHPCSVSNHINHNHGNLSNNNHSNHCQSHLPRCKARVKYSISPNYRRASSLTSRNCSPGGRHHHNHHTMTNKKMANTREDAKKKAKCLPEFNIDQVESWMTMCDKQHTQQDKQLTCLNKSLTTLEESFEKLTQDTMDILNSSLSSNKLKTNITEKQEKREDNNDGADGGDIDKDSLDKLSISSQDDSTYDEIVSVIKEIDEDKKKELHSPSITGSQDLELKFTPRQEEVSSARGKDVSVGTNGDCVSGASPDKLQDILSYLDNVEDSCEKTLLETRRSIPETNRSEVEFVVEPDIVEDVPKLSDLLMLPNHQLARRVVALSLRANELSNALILSKELVNKLRMEKQRLVRAEKSQAAVRLKEQKKSYETIVKRHQGFIEQLLKDKGSLCEKVSALTRRIESQNQAWEHRLETEVTRVKENTLAGEKIRRERWIRENTKKIKELTVKGLETEINKMAANHQREINELKQNHQQQLLDAVEEVRLRHEQIENNIRENSAQDREVLIAKERNAIIERFEKQLMEERHSFYEQKTKLVQDFEEEKERLVTGFRVKENDLEQRRVDWQRERDLEGQQRFEEMQAKFNKQEENYQNRLTTIQKQFEADFELWKKEYESNCKIQQAEKENLIRQHYRTERDRQIDVIVQRMDAEALKANEEFETKISRLKEKQEKDMRELENAEGSIREKYAEIRGKLAESDAQGRNFQAEIKQLQIELEHSKKMCNDYLKEREQIHDQIKGEMQEKYQAVKLERDQEIQQIHKRVQQAIEKKDATVDLLQKENGSLRERCLKLEAVIRQQRKDYCVK